MGRLRATILALAFFSPAVSAGDLVNFITDLYGGDGIRLFVSPTAASHDAHFTTESINALSSLNSSVTSATGFSAFNSPASGVTFDLSTGVPVSTQESLGPLLSERATTLGANKLNVSFSYTRVDFSRFEGTDLDSFSFELPHIDVNNDGILGPPGSLVELDTVTAFVDITLEQDIYALFGNYGLTDYWDVGIVIPVIRVEARANAFATVTDITGGNVHTFLGAIDEPQSSSGGAETGFGDVILRTKYNFMNGHAALPDMAITAQLTLPTGDEDNLLGTGHAKLRGQFIASKKFGDLTPHVNVSYEETTGIDRFDNLSYAAGFDWRVSAPLTVAADVMGRYNPDLKTVSNHIVDVGLAAKWNPFNHHEAPLNAYVILPVNKDSGLRADVIWGLGIEYTFQ
ncbi:MAG: hypothetical protein ACI9BW_003559 [Gammaproteobacteria bacterium]|jgi:hypothetical protein